MSENEVSEKKFNFGPRIKMRPPQRIGQPLQDRNLLGPHTSQDLRKPEQSATFDSRSTTDPPHEIKAVSSSDPIVSDLQRHIIRLERERDEWRLKAESAIAQSELSLGDMLVEIELETLREEVKRLTSLTVTDSTVEQSNSDAMESLRIRCAELETQVVALKKEKTQMEQKNAAARNADSNRIRALQEQVAHEKRMRERAVATESSLQVVSVDRPSTPSNHQVLVRPLSGSVPENAFPVPAFLVNGPSEHVPKPPVRRDLPVAPIPAPAVNVSKILEKTMILPIPRLSIPTTVPTDTIGDDYIANQWRSLLVDKPPAWLKALSRVPNTNIFCFGTLKVACKKIGNNIMIQLGRETMMLDKFVDMYGTEEMAAKLTPVTAQVPAATKPPPVTMKSILASKKN